LHAHFWGKTEALTRKSWLARPADRDAAALLADAQEGLQQIIAASAYDDTLTPHRLHRLLTLARHPRPLLTLLQATPPTLLHGDAGFQNIAVAENGATRIWFDWQLAGMGPAALDLVTFLHPWAYPQAHPPFSYAEMVDLYLHALETEGILLEKTLFARQLDAALLWRWLSQWAPLLGKYRARLRDDIRIKLYHAFAQLHWPALARWQ
jgi:thiamine kinase-like enzyme